MEDSNISKLMWTDIEQYPDYSIAYNGSIIHKETGMFINFGDDNKEIVYLKKNGREYVVPLQPLLDKAFKKEEIKKKYETVSFISKPIKGFSNYLISNLGVVYNIETGLSTFYGFILNKKVILENNDEDESCSEFTIQELLSMHFPMDYDDDKKDIIVYTFLKYKDLYKVAKLSFITPWDVAKLIIEYTKKGKIERINSYHKYYKLKCLN